MQSEFALILNYAMQKAGTLHPAYRKLLILEKNEIEKQGIEQYWVDLIKSQKKFKTNKNRLVLPFLLKLTSSDPLADHRAIFTIHDKDGVMSSAYDINGVIVGADIFVLVDGDYKLSQDVGKLVQCKLKTTNATLSDELIINNTKFRPAICGPLAARIHGQLDLNDDAVYKDPDLPDIDLDFLPSARDKIKAWAAQYYGQDKVCSVGSWQTYNPKSALADVARAMGYSEKKEELIDLGKTLPHDFDDATFEEAYSDQFPTFKDWVDKDAVNLDIAKSAFNLVGKIRTQGKHAGGLIISSVSLPEHLPMAKLKGQWTSEWTEGKQTQLSKFGFVKYDILGLTTMQYIFNACKYVEENHGIKIDWEEIGYDDKEAFKLASQLKTDSIFQFDTDIAKGILSDGGVKSIDDLMVYTSLGRPGPMPMIKVYIARRDNPDGDWKTEEHPAVLELLKDTYGVCIYQEQVTLLLTKLAGFSIPEADKARKIMSKKWADQMVWVREKILRGFSKTLTGHCPHQAPNEFDEIELLDEICGTTEWTWAKEYWKRLSTFARYSFNRSHATAYSLQSYRCLYLKAHYPVEWWCAVLNSCDLDRIPQYIATAKREGIQFGTIDFRNLSGEFLAVNNQIVPGLLGVKNIGDKLLSTIQLGKQEYENFDEFIDKNGSNKILIERLVKLGAFDSAHPHRKMLWYWYQYKYGNTKDARDLRKKITQQISMSEEEIKQKREEMAKEYLEQHPKRKVVPKRILNWKPVRKQLSFNEFAALFKGADYTYKEKLDFQQQYLGYYWDSPIDMYCHNKHHNIKRVKTELVGRLDCVVINVEHRQTNSGSVFLTLTVSDGIDIAKLNVWSNTIDTYPDDYFAIGAGLSIDVKWSGKYKSLSIPKYGKITTLQPANESGHVVDLSELECDPIVA